MGQRVEVGLKPHSGQMPGEVVVPRECSYSVDVWGLDTDTLSHTITYPGSMPHHLLDIVITIIILSIYIDGEMGVVKVCG